VVNAEAGAAATVHHESALIFVVLATAKLQRDPPGPAAWDERHRAVVTGGIHLPYDLAASVQAIYASARPFTALVGGDPNGDLDVAHLRWGPMQLGIAVNAYNLFNRTNGVPSSVQKVIDNPDLPPVGQPLAAFASRHVEVGVQARVRPERSRPRPPPGRRRPEGGRELEPSNLGSLKCEFVLPPA